MNRTTFPSLALLTVLCCGSAIPVRAQTTLPPPALHGPQSASSVTLQLGLEGVRVAMTEDQAEQLREKIPKGSVLVVCHEVQVMPVLKNGEPVLRIVCRRAVFGTHHGLEGRADLLQFDSDDAIRLVGAELIVDRYHDDHPPDKISAREITVELKDLRITLDGVCTLQPGAKKTPQTGHVPQERTSAR